MWDRFYQSLLEQVSMLRFTDFIDILIVTYVIYKALRFIRDTRTVQLLKGVVIVVVIMQISYFANLHTVYYILSNLMQLGVIAILIMFQPEIRRALEQVGQAKIGRWFNFEEQQEQAEKSQMIDEIVRSCQTMSESRIGALIVVERESKLGEIIDTGIHLNADVSAELLVNIFIPKTPLHDGAVVVRDNKIVAAASFLPLSQNPNLSKELGTRHRAGLGVSEESDAVVVIVSEETGGISLAIGGELNVNLNGETLAKGLKRALEADGKESKIKRNPFVRKEKS